MTGRLQGKIALITGAARGQGEAEARLFAAEGATVVMADVLDAQGEAAAAAIGAAARYVPLDVRDEARWAQVVGDIVRQHGRLDVLVNNAGIFPKGGLLTTTLAEFERVVGINQTGVFLGMQAAARVMVPQRGGSIINISSIAGLAGAAPFIGYSTTKWAVRGLTRSGAKELAQHGVRVNSVHPGIIDTPMLQTFDAMHPGTRAQVESRIPMGRTASADEVARLVLFLASDESSYISGSEHVIDGAWTA